MCRLWILYLIWPQHMLKDTTQCPHPPCYQPLLTSADNLYKQFEPRMLVLIWIQTVWHSNSFWKKVNFAKKSANNKSMKNYPACNELTLNAPIETKVICFSRLLKCLRSLYGKQCGPRSDCSYRSSLFWVHAVSILNSSVMIGNYLQQTTSADDIFRCIFPLAL